MCTGSASVCPATAIHLVFTFTTIIVLNTSQEVLAAVIEVPGDFPTIQQAINAAVDGDEVVVADGTYTGPLNKNLDFSGKAITVRSASGDPSVCVIDCEDDGRGFYFHTGEGSDSIVDSLTITNGHAAYGGSFYGGGVFCESSSSPTLMNCSITASMAYLGGGVSCYSYSSPTLTNCSITGNSVIWNGGGVHCDDHSTPTLANCSITGNTASWDGGGIFCYDNSSPALTDCVVAGNTAAYRGGGVYCWSVSNPTLSNCVVTNNIARQNGGGIYCVSYSSPALTNCSITGNTAYGDGGYWGDGGGLSCNDNSSPTLTNCSITGNTAYCDGGNELGYGGGLCCGVNSSPNLTNCSITSNTANVGGAIYCLSGSPDLTSCSITGNAAHSGGGIYCADNGRLTLTNCVLWADAPDEIFIFSGEVAASYCNIQGGWSGIANIDLDPLFVNPPNDDYHLSPASPCIDSGDNTAIRESFDLDANPRVIDDPGRWDSGNGVSPIVDIGCYEFQGDSTGISVLTIAPQPLIARQDGVFTTVNTSPNTATYLAYSLRGLGNTYVKALNVTLDLARPDEAGGKVTSDGAGTAQWVLRIPSAGAGRHIWFQACQRELKTNVVMTSIE